MTTLPAVTGARDAPPDLGRAGDRPPHADLLHDHPVSVAVLLGALGWAAAWAAVTLAGPVLGVPLEVGETSPGAGALLAVLGCSLAGVAAAASGWRVLSRPGGVPVLVVSGASALLVGTSTVVLHGTRWGFDAIYSDAGFRTQAVTRFADSPALADYTYRGLPTYYPPLLPWLQGRAADLLGVPGWTVLKPVELLACLLVPVASWLLWRRVVVDPLAAWVAAAVAVGTALVGKPDEWLVLALVLPWWLEVARGVRAPDRRHWSSLRQGLVLGLLMLVHTYFLLPLAIATALGMAVDLLVRRPVRPRPRRALVIALVGLAVATPSWVPMVLPRLRHLPADNLQMRWSPPGFDVPPLPLPVDAVGVLGFVGVAWLLWHVHRSRLAEALGLALVTSYAMVLGGQLLQRWDVALLPEKSGELCLALLLVTGVVAVRRLAPSPARWGPRVHGLAVGALIVLAVLGIVQRPLDQLVSSAMPAQHVRYPDGRFPAGGPPPADSHWHPWGVPHDNSGPSVRSVQQAWQGMTGRPLDAGTVLVSARADVPATVPVHSFVAWKSIYSHPNGRFADRVRVLQRVAACGDARCAADLLRRNGLDAVDGLLLNRSTDGWYVSVAVDTFPDGWVPLRITFDPDLFRAPYFRTRELPGAALVVVRR